MRTTISAGSARKQRSSFNAAVLAAFFGAAATVAHTPEARADEVSPKGKGMVGGGLLGAEVVTITEAIIGVRNPIFYGIGAAVGAGGGVVGGYFVEQSSTDGRVPVYMLAGGLALVIPALVLTLNATRYRPREDATEDRAPTNEPSANPGKAGGTSVLGADPAPSPGTSSTTLPPPAGGGASTPGPGSPSTAPPPPQSLLDIQVGGGPTASQRTETWRMGVPVPQVKPMYTAREQQQMGLPQQTEVRMPVLHVVF
jgi:hypothetical protein